MLWYNCLLTSEMSERALRLSNPNDANVIGTRDESDTEEHGGRDD